MPGSPKKGRPSSPSKNTFSQSSANVESENQNLQFSLGERDVEIERMKITLIALNEKLAVTNDVKLDCVQFKEYFSVSETSRVELQV